MAIRIIAGALKRRKLQTLPGKNIRPTSDRLRESIFNILSTQVSDAVVLDLFSGTGAMGIEALSRGAKFCVFIDKNKNALDLVRKNSAHCGLENCTLILGWDLARNLDCLKTLGKNFDLVFMDPPYHQAMVHPALIHLHTSAMLKNGARIVIEHGSREIVPDEITGYEKSDQRQYGKTTVSILTYISSRH